LNGLTVSAWEARVLGKLDDHPNIATAQDYWEEGETQCHLEARDR
jgi:hypothetical protein